MGTIGDARQRSGISRWNLVRDQCLVAGKWCSSATGETALVHDPFTGFLIGSVPMLSRGEVDQAVHAAALALPAWSNEPARHRGRILRRWADLIEANREDLARLITLENGKPLAEARGEVDYGLGFVEFYAEEAGRILGEVLPPNQPGRRLCVEREPVGVCAAITPWNFPVAMLTRKLAPALAAGCTVIAKPAMETPLSAFALAMLAEEAGVPPGVINVVTGDPRMIGEVFTGSMTVRKLSFTGSTPIGAMLAAASAATMKRLSLELGGNAPLLIFDDADLDTALDTAMAAKFRNGGQSCIAANRIYVQDGIHDRFVAGFSARVAGLKFGDGFVPETDIGPLIREAAVEKVVSHFDDAVAKGARLVAGSRPQPGRLASPALLVDAPHDILLSAEETFGPLAVVMRFRTIDKGLALANDTPFGLAAYVCSENRATIALATRALEIGMVGVNTGLISTATAPFGGVKLSGLGREGSRHGLDEYLNFKYLCEAGF